MGWDDAKKEAAQKDGQGGSDLFVRLKNDGDVAIGVIVGEPVPTLGKPFKPGDAPSKKFLFNFYDLESSRMRVIEVNAATFTKIANLHDKGHLKRFAVEIKRQGVAGDKKTTYHVTIDAEIAPELAAKIKGTEPVNLARIAEKNEERGGSAEQKPPTTQRPAYPRPDAPKQPEKTFAEKVGGGETPF